MNMNVAVVETGLIKFANPAQKTKRLNVPTARKKIVKEEFRFFQASQVWEVVQSQASAEDSHEQDLHVASLAIIISTSRNTKQTLCHCEQSEAISQPGSGK